MSATTSSSLMRGFRLTGESDGLGLSCTPASVSLAGVPLLRSTQAGFVPRPAFEVAALLRAGYGKDTRLLARLGAIAQALNRGDFATAMIAAVHTRTPDLTPEAARRVVNAEAELAKYSPDEPRDWHGRWTRGSAGSEPSDGSPVPNRLPQNGVENLAATDAAAASSVGSNGETAESATSLEQTFEKKFDDLGPVDFAKQVIQFGDWLGRNGRNLSPADLAYATAEYTFLQDRLSFWLAYNYKPVQAQSNLLSAALTLYEGAVNGGVVRPGQLPQSMLDTAGTAAVFTDGPPRRPSTQHDLDEASSASAEAPSEIEGLGGTVDNSEAKIVWGKGIKDQNGQWEDYYETMNPGTTRLPPGSKGFDHFDEATGEAISNKTLNTLSVTYIRDPLDIYRKVVRYVDDAVNYQPRTDVELDPAAIDSKTIYLAVPEYTSPTQWRYLLRAVVYGKDNGVSIVITRIRE
jgi:hypothetical protein